MCGTFSYIKNIEQENKEIIRVNNFCRQNNKYGPAMHSKSLPQGISYMQTRI